LEPIYGYFLMKIKKEVDVSAVVMAVGQITMELP
jgi:hypothetical protein